MDYNKIKKHFETGRWNAAMVKMAVRKGVISQEECDAILSGTEPKPTVTEQELINSIMQEVAGYDY